MAHQKTLSELLELPEGLTEEEKNLCLASVKLLGVDLAQELAELLMRKHSFLVDYKPTGQMPNREAMLGVLPSNTIAASWSADKPGQIKIELENKISVTDLETILSTLTPPDMNLGDGLTALDMDWS